MTITTDNSLGDLVAANPAAARIFERFDLDYCCHGDRTLADACTSAGIDADAVADALVGLEDAGDEGWATLTMPALVDHIVEIHHRYLQEELPLLESLAGKVASVHGERHPELDEVERLVSALRADLEPHMLKEERVLFPAICAIVDGERDFPFGSVENPVRMMVLEHEQAGDLLAELRRVTHDHEVPADACASYRSLYERLAALELDTHLHIHKENHTLFPAAIELFNAPA
jgi:regulator of cell morphogenesis and NO signaling